MKLDITKTNMSIAYSSPIPILNIVKGLEDYINDKPALMRINHHPKYQRDEVWDQDFKEKLILSVIVNYPIGNIILRTLDHSPTSFNEVTHEIVDGQQRLLAIMDFLHNKYKLGNEISKSLLEERGELFQYDIDNDYKNSASKIYKKYLTNKEAKFKLSFSDLPTPLQNQINNYPLNVIYVSSTEDAIAQYFRFIQNQERLRAGEIINSIPDSYLTQYLNKIKNKNIFLEKIHWNESRKEFDKIFYSMIGVFDEKINFGTTDLSIIEYAGNCEGIGSEALLSTERMINTINAISECNIANKGKFSKRLIKFLFLSAGFGFVDYTKDTNKKFKLLLDIEAKLPYFNSTDTTQLKKIFNNYPENIIFYYNQLFVLGRGSHSSKKTKNIIRNIAYIMDYENKK